MYNNLINASNEKESRQGLINAASCALLKALANSSRIRIYNLLTEKGCVSFSELMRKLGMKSSKHLRYHLDVMKKTKLIEEKRIRFVLTPKKKSKKYFYLNTRVELRLHDAVKPILDVPLSSDKVNDFIAEFEEQKERGTIPEEVAKEIIEKIRVAKELKKLQNKIEDVKFRA